MTVPEETENPLIILAYPAPSPEESQSERERETKTREQNPNHLEGNLASPEVGSRDLLLGLAETCFQACTRSH